MICDAKFRGKMKQSSMTVLLKEFTNVFANVSNFIMPIQYHSCLYTDCGEFSELKLLIGM